MRERLKKAVSIAALKNAASRVARIRISRRAGIGILCFLAALLFLYAALGFWVLPSYVKSKAQRIAAEKLHRQLVINRLDFNPFTFTLNVEGVSLSEPDSEARFAAFDQLHVEVSGWSVLNMTPVVTEFRLVRPFVHIVRFSEETRNFDDIMALFKTQQEEAPQKEEAQAETEKSPQNAAQRRAAIRKRRFGIYNFQIVDARIELEDREKGTQTLISDFHAGLPYLYRGPIRGIARHVEPRLEAMINGRKLEISRETPAEDSRDRILRLDMDNIDLKQIFSYVPFHPAYRFNEGWLDLHLSFHMRRPKDGAASMDIGGQITVRSVHMTQHGKPFFDLEKLDLRLGANSPAQKAYRIDRLEIVRPEIHVISDRKGILNVADLLAHAGGMAAPAEDEETPSGNKGGNDAMSSQQAEPAGMTLELKELLVKKARLRYTDESDVMPVEASTGSFDLVAADIRADLAARAVRAGQVQSSGGSFDVAMRRANAAPAAKKDGKKEDGAPAFTVQVDRLGIANWSGRVKGTSARDSASLPFSAVFSRFGITAENTEIDPGRKTVSVGALLSSGANVDLTLEDHPAGNRTPVASGEGGAFHVSIGRIGIANWSGRLKNHNRGDLAALPVSAELSRFGLNVEQAQVDMKNTAVSIERIHSTGGTFDVLVENRPPTVPVFSGGAKEDGTPYHIRVGRVDVANWSGKVKNSNRNDPFEIPFSANFTGLGVTVEGTDISLKDKTVTVAAVASKGGNADIGLEPYKKPWETGRRATARAALLASIIEAKKAQPADGFAISVGKVAVSDWSARVKNKNTTDRAGLPLSGRAQKIDLAVADVKLDMKKRDIRIGEVASKSVVLMGQLEKHEKEKAKKAAGEAREAAMPQEDPYVMHIGRLAIDGWTVKGRNLNLKNPLGASVTGLSVTGQDLSSTPGAASRFSVRATVDRTGKFAADGRVGLFPLDVNLALDMKDLSIVAIQPYIEDYVNLTLDRANLSLSGTLVLKERKEGGIEGGYRGDVFIGQLRTVDQINKDSFIRWNLLAMKEVDARFMPLSVKVREAELNNFFARVILNADGRLNLRNIMRSDTGGQTSLTETDEELDDLADTGDARKSTVENKSNVTIGRVRPDADGKEREPPLVFVEKLTLKKGRVRFTDNFIKPNYTASISELEGTVTALSSDPDAFARLDLRGQVNRAPLVVAGTISPFRENLTLDVKAQVRGMELAQFSSYTTKYIGYGIDKGKLSFDVEYKLEEGVLVAQNRLILDQLTFGEKAPGEPVTSLPVELAVSLLKDSNGIIDINLPVGGSLDDPDFSIGGILARVFLGSLKRVILSPFAFLSIRFGGGAELSWLEFAPGSSVIPDGEIPRLEALAKALAERPELKLDITGRYDPDKDRAGLAKAAIERKVRMLKRKDIQEKGQTAATPQLKIEENEYPALLERVYRDEDIKKPRNFIGMQKTLSVPEMEKVMLDAYEATEEEFLALAYQRAERTKSWLVEKGKVADSRIFLLASKAGESGENGETAARVDFSIQQ